MGRQEKIYAKGIFSKRQIEMLSGVYFPYWMLDAELEARLDAVAETYAYGARAMSKQGSQQVQGLPGRHCRL